MLRLGASDRTRRRCGTTALIVLVSATSCGGGTAKSDGSGSRPESTRNAPVVRRVPEGYRTIQAAVDATTPGDLVLIAPGEYREKVVVQTPDIVLRGLDRNRVVIRAPDETADEPAENGIMVFSNGVAVENLTVRGFRSNGIVFTGSYDEGDVLDGFRVSHVTVHDNALYGVYAFGARNGLIEHVYASGSRDGGVYIGQCAPCDTLVRDLLAENNAVGYLGTNSGGNLYLVESVLRNNRVGIQPNSSNKERLAPGRGFVAAANLVIDNNNANTPKATEAIGIGVGIGGAQDVHLVGNTIERNGAAGVVVGGNEGYAPTGTRVERNTVTGNGVDLALVVPGAEGSCFTGNQFATSSPPQIEGAWPCAGSGTGAVGTLDERQGPPAADRSTLPEPPPQPGMDSPKDAPAVPATASFEPPDLAALQLPDEAGLPPAAR